jgi:tetratricopeptide (TPR) repeat protein
MRTLNKSLFCLLTFIAIPLFGTDAALELAEKFFNANFYDEAITEYQRYIHFNPGTQEASYAYYKIALAYRNKYNLEESLKAMENAAQAALTDSIRNERKIDVAITYIAMEKYDKAKFTLLKLTSFSDNSEIKRKASLFLGVAHLYLYEWRSAKEALGIYFEEKGNSQFAQAIDSLLSSAKNLDYKSPKTARLLSTFIPGTGQIYSGNIGDGINSMLINDANIYFIIYKLLKEEYANAYLIYFFLFRRYYFGNIYYAKKGAIEHNRELNEERADSIFKLLRNIEQ